MKCIYQVYKSADDRFYMVIPEQTPYSSNNADTHFEVVYEIKEANIKKILELSASTPKTTIGATISVSQSGLRFNEVENIIKNKG